MKAIVALVLALVAFPATAAQDHGPWWDCVSTILSKRDGIAGGKPVGMLALDAMVACRGYSMRENAGEDVDALIDVIEHFRRLATMPGAPPAFTRPRQ
jgi:hypothetical protein